MIKSSKETSKIPEYSRPHSSNVWKMGGYVVCVMLVLWTGSSAVTVNVKSPVYLQLPAGKLILPCNFSTKNSGVECIVIWKHGLVNSSAVISKHPNGDIYQRPSYKNRARFGSGCSCELSSPKENDAGIYKVEVVCNEDDQSQVTAQVDVILIPKDTAQVTTTLLHNKSSHMERSTSSTQSTVDEEQADNIGVLVAVTVAVPVVLGTVAAIICVVCCCRSKRRLNSADESAHQDEFGAEMETLLRESSSRRDEGEAPQSSTSQDGRSAGGQNITGNTIGSSDVIAAHISGSVNIHHGVSFSQKDAEKDSERYQKWCKDRADKHVRTSLSHQVLNELREKKSVLLLADAGDGKSTLLQLVAIQFGEDGFLTLEIDTPADINNYNIDGKNVLFVCDNLLGEAEINEDKTKAWKNSENKQFPESAKFLFACRLEFWGKKKADLCRKQIFNDTVVVRSDKLTYTDKKEMLDGHVGDRMSEDTKKQIAEECNFAFPESCRFVSRSSNINFSDGDKLVEIFSNPFNFVKQQMETVEKNNKIQYAVLLFCLLNEGKFPKNGTPDVYEQCNFKKVKRLYLSDIMCSAEQLYDTLLDNVEELNGWLLTEKGENYTFYNDNIFQAMFRRHVDRYPEHILTYCKPEVVFSVFTTNQVSGSDSDRVTLPPRCYEQLVEVVTAECVKECDVINSEMWGFVFEQMNTADILKEWSVFLKRKLSLIKELSPPPFSREHTEPTLFEVLKLFSELPDCGLSVGDVFVCAACHGDLQTSTLALESGVDSDDRVDGLMYAADEGHSDIVTMIVQWTDPDIQDMSSIEELCEAMRSERGERVVEIMRSQPDIHTDIKHMVLQWAAWRRHSDAVREMIERTDMDMEGIVCGLHGAVMSDNVECLTQILMVRPDIDTVTIQSVLQLAVWFGSVRCVRELLKRPDISKHTIQEMLQTVDSELFWSRVTQTVRDKTRAVLVKHLDTDS